MKKKRKGVRRKENKYMSRTAVFYLLYLLMNAFSISFFAENFQEITIKQPLTVRMT